MERGELDVKRLRLDHPSGPIASDSSISSSNIPPHHHHLPPLPQHSGSPTAIAPISAPAAIGSHQFSTTQNQHSIPNLQHLNSAPTGYSASRPANINTASAPPGPQGPFHQPYGTVNQHSRHRPQDSVSRPSTATGQPDHHRPDWVAPSMEGNAGPARHSQPPHQHVYPQHHSLEPINGLPHSAPPTMSQYPVQSPAPGPVPQHVDHYNTAPPPGYPQTPVGGSFPTPNQYAAQGGYGPPGKPNRKSARATQACNQCRSRKQKCDEQRPCTYCKQEGVACEYKEVPPPKADKHTAQMIDAQKALDDRMTKFAAKYENQQQDMMKLLRFIAKSLPSDGEESSASDIIELLNRAQTPKATATTPLPNGIRNAEMLPPSSPARMHSKVVESNASEETSHYTGAQYLQRWPLISEFFREAGVESEDYVSTFEEANGQFRNFHIGFSGDHIAKSVSQGTSPANMGDGSSTSSHQSVPEEAFYDATYENLHVAPNNLGGLNPNYELRLDSFLVRRFFNSYMTTMWVIYPIFNANELRQKMDRFIQRYSPEAEHAHSPYHAATSYPQAGDKRKHSNSDIDHDHYATKPRKKVDHTLSNAIVLLVMALGSLCHRDGFLMQPDPTPAVAQRYLHHHGSPKSVKYSPVQSTASMSSPSDYDTMRSGMGSRGSSLERNPHVMRGRPLNVQTIPGLAYWTQAAQIIGQWHGSRDLQWIQVNILAGLYWGQIGKVLKSHSHLKIAADIMCEFIRKNHARLSSEQEDDHTQLLLLICWSIYQLEGDIRAELDHLPSSGLARFCEAANDQICMPVLLPGCPAGDKYINLYDQSLHVGKIMRFFSAQLHIRKILNEAHNLIYKSNSSQEISVQTQTLWDWVFKWRAFEKWEDSEPPPDEINVARFRAKFYGAAYISTRPHLYNALCLSKQEQQDLINKWDYEMLGKQDLLSEGSLTDVGTASRRCILAALYSTVAFDGLLTDELGNISKRPKLPNIQGTMAAQFSNMLVVANTYLNELTRPLVPEETFLRYLDRTIRLLDLLSPVSPVFKANVKVLRAAQARVFQRYYEIHPGGRPIYDQSPRVSNISITAPATPQDYQPGSANTSFSAPH